MRKRSRVPLLLLCAIAGVACGNEKLFEPETLPAPVFTTLEIRPAVADLFPVAPGNTVQLSVGARDQLGTPMPGTGAATYSSSAPEIAEVSSSGMVTAVAPGIAEIMATFTLGPITRTAIMAAVVGPHNQTPGEYPDIVAGVYDLTAPILSFDPAVSWGDLRGYSYTAVLTLQRNNGDKFEGTYADLQLIGPGYSSDWQHNGFVRGSLDVEGRVVIELIGGDHTWTWSGQGMLDSEKIVGRYGCCADILGIFTAKRR